MTVTVQAGAPKALAAAADGTCLAVVPPPGTSVLIFTSADSFHEPCGVFGPKLGDASANHRRSCFASCACSSDGEDIAVADAGGCLSILARCEPGVHVLLALGAVLIKNQVLHSPSKALPSR